MLMVNYKCFIVNYCCKNAVDSIQVVICTSRVELCIGCEMHWLLLDSIQGAGFNF